MPSSTFRESEFIAWATADFGGDLLVGPGDDAAVTADGLLLCLDTVVEGTHFEPGTPLELVARKAVGSCVSDACAMGGRATSALVSAQLPPGTDGRSLARALAHWCRAFSVDLVGGDTVSAPPGALALAVTIVGRCERPPWRRSGGRVGDVLYVSGPLGGSRAGRHLRVVPRRDVVDALVAAGTEVHACIDLSDGLARDLPRLCGASATGARVDAERLPVHADVDVARDGVLAALADGEDFELLLALPPQTRVPAGCVAIGELVAGDALVLRRAGRDEPWPDAGYEHAF